MLVKNLIDLRTHLLINLVPVDLDICPVLEGHARDGHSAEFLDMLPQALLRPVVHLSQDVGQAGQLHCLLGIAQAVEVV